jgi:hypothetical protein
VTDAASLTLPPETPRPPSDKPYVTDTTPPGEPKPENPEGRHLALITALVEIFAVGRDDESMTLRLSRDQ